MLLLNNITPIFHSYPLILKEFMNRDLMQSLLRWKDQSDRMPLLLRGARQVGKTYLIEWLGGQGFDNFININFEIQPEFKACFESLDPAKIINMISLLTSNSIIQGRTLLFLDEVQECPAAIQSLRYFKERMPELHIVAAGSLLEFVLNDTEFRMPVGRIQSLYLKPLSFYEYLDAIGHHNWREHLSQVTLETGIENVLHTQLLKSLKDYLLIGGMPAVIQSYLQHHDYQLCQEKQAAILDTYRSDFGKYAKQINHRYLQLIFSKAPGMVGKTIKYSHFSQDIQARELKPALQLLIHAGIVHPIYLTQASGLPLTTGQVESKFKLLFLDIGLMQYSSRLGADILLADDILLLNRGALAEQFVGQELLTIMRPYEQSELFYWERNKAGSTAEVDYISHAKTTIFPVEVKAGKTGRLRSLQVFLQEKKLEWGIRISQKELSLENNILSVPFYMIPEIDRLLLSIT